jgi:hypothetical protein
MLEMCLACAILMTIVAAPNEGASRADRRLLHGVRKRNPKKKMPLIPAAVENNAQQDELFFSLLRFSYFGRGAKKQHVLRLRRLS